jgi:hypothetical protein
VVKLQIKGFSFLAENFHPTSMILSRKVRRNLPTQPSGRQGMFVSLEEWMRLFNSSRDIILKLTVDPLYLLMTALHALVDFIRENVRLIVSRKLCLSPNGDNYEATGQKTKLLLRKSRKKSARKEQ